MNTRKAYAKLLFLLLLTTAASAQYIQVNDTYSPQQLVQDILLNSPCVTVSNVSVSGGAFANGQSYGYFNGTGSSFAFQNGIILSTGRAVGAEGPNTSLLDDGGNMSWGGDTDLEQALGINNSINATVLEFDFIPLANTLSFQYLLSSEEYHDNAPCKYSDGFAFLLKETGSTAPYTNLAIIPGTDIPVKVTSVHPQIGGNGGCPAQNEEYFDAFNGSEHPTNFNGQTRVMTAHATVVPGTQYHIKLVIADEGNFRYDSAIFLGGGSFTASTDLGPDRLFSTNNPLCNGEAYVLDGTTPNATGYQWSKNNVPITGATNATYTATGAGDYSVTVQFTSSCTADGFVSLEYNAPLTFGTYTLLQCDDNGDGLTAYDLAHAAELAKNGNPNLTATGYFTSLSDAQNNANAITVTNPFYNTAVNQPIYIRMQNQYGCQGIATVNLSTSGNTVTNPAPYGLCDTDGTDDGFFTFDLTTLDSQILAGLPTGLQSDYYPSYTDALTFTNIIGNPQSYINTTADQQSVYARISQGADCYGIAEVKLIVYNFGGTLHDENVTQCVGLPLTLPAPAGYTSYSWDTTPVQTTPEIIVTAPGQYTVTITNAFNCTATKTFTVKQSGSVSAIDFDINDFRGGYNSITVLSQGVGDYEYAIDVTDFSDLNNYQDSNTFNNLEEGLHTVYINDKNGCGIAYKSVYILDYPKFFTPNGDSYNETWRIKHLATRPDIKVVIYDRFGKVITGFSGNSTGWDGTLNGNRLPATDYWFTITLENGRVVRGHFALIR